MLALPLKKKMVGRRRRKRLTQSEGIKESNVSSQEKLGSKGEDGSGGKTSQGSSADTGESEIDSRDQKNAGKFDVKSDLETKDERRRSQISIAR